MFSPAASTVPLMPQAPVALNVAPGGLVQGGVMPVTAIAPLVNNDKVDFHLRQQAQARHGHGEDEGGDEAQGEFHIAFEVAGGLWLGFAPFFAQLIAQAQDAGMDLEGMYRQAMMSRRGGADRSLNALLGLGASEVPGFTPILLPQHEASAPRRVMSMDYANLAYSQSLARVSPPARLQ